VTGSGLDRGDELAGRVAIVTGGGRGLGRHHALFLASRGAKVVVNDLGGGLDGDGNDANAAEAVAAEIVAAGGEAIANTDNVTDWQTGENLVKAAVAEFGALHILVNNAGIVRGSGFAGMTEGEWDSVLAVHLRGHFVTSRHAAAYWQAEHDAGRPVRASVINTTSRGGLYPGRPNKSWTVGVDGRVNYAAAKAAIAAMTVGLSAELGPYGIRVNAIAPVARTRMTEASPHVSQIVAAPEDTREFDTHDPANVSPVIGWLATEDCPMTGQVYFVFGGTVQPMTGWTRDGGVSKNGRWSIDELRSEIGRLEVVQPTGDVGR
jgi:NAD(P)-dependent dehydrogenase (short-subunit alcohol dehydrogenase family)